MAACSMAEGLPPTEAALRRRRQRRRAAILAQLAGKHALPEDQQCTLEVAKIIREDFLQQKGSTDHGFMCPLGKLQTIGNHMKEWVKLITDMDPLSKVVCETGTKDMVMVAGEIMQAKLDYHNGTLGFAAPGWDRAASPRRSRLQVLPSWTCA